MKPFKDLDGFLELIENQPKYKLLINDLPNKQFFYVNKNWPALQLNLHRYLVLWLYRPILLHGKMKVETDKSFKMSIGTLHYLLSDILPVGYILEFPKNAKLEVNFSFVSATLGKVGYSLENVSDIPPVQHELIDKHLSVYVQNTTQLVACKTELVDFLT